MKATEVEVVSRAEEEAAGIEAPAMEVLGRRMWWGITA
jgi:hypothetical protein